MCNCTNLPKVPKVTTMSSLSAAYTKVSVGPKNRNNKFGMQFDRSGASRHHCSASVAPPPQVSTGVRFSEKKSEIEAVEKTKKVSFSPAQAQVLEIVKPSSRMSQEEKEDKYWQLSDYEYFKGTAQFVAKEIRRLSLEEKESVKSYSSTMTRIYEMSHILASRPVSNDSVSLSNLIPPQEFRLVSEWARIGHARRGLEKWAVESHSKYRPQARTIHVQSVLKAQELLKQKKSCFKIFGEEKKDEIEMPNCSTYPQQKEDILSKVSERYSRHSRIFSELMGSADAAAIGLH